MSGIQGAYDGISIELMSLRAKDPEGVGENTATWERVIKDVERLKAHLVAVISEGREALVEKLASDDARLWTHAALQGMNVEVQALRKRQAERDATSGGSKGAFDRGRTQGQEETVDAVATLLAKGAIDDGVGKALLSSLRELLEEVRS